MQKLLFLLIPLLFLSACKQKPETAETSGSTASTVKYAQGFSIEKKVGGTEIILKNPWPGAEETFKYWLIEEGATVKEHTKKDAIVQVPLESIVVTSTTHIPSLEMLGIENKLVGFPNMNYISSEKTRKLITEGKIKELGKNEDINTEVLIELAPDAVITFAVEGNNKTVSTIQKTGIPVLYNSDWTETHPLGKAEWIKFFGALFGKEREADSIFASIEKNYLEAKSLAANATTRPTVLSGAMYKDIWYMPQGDSWAARFIDDAHGEYLWSEDKGTGSLSLNLESVLEKGQSADFWIGPGQFTSLQQMEEAHTVYTQFEAFQNKKIYSFTTKKGATGGVLYYELAPNRPDLVLKDIIKILHPELSLDHELYFFSFLE
ncbi:MAG: ABC transporter substrate-binding protein [Bacteroidota bacterium]